MAENPALPAASVAASSSVVLSKYLGGAPRSAWIAQRKFTKSLIAGVGVGLIVGVLYVFGINRLKLQIDAPHASEGVAFVLAAVGGFFGPKLLGTLKPA